MKAALQDSERTIAVYSPNYFNSGFGEDEWTAAFADGSLLGVRVRDCEIPKLLKPRVYIDLLTLDPKAARDALVAGVKRESAKPNECPNFPTDAGKPKRFPGEPPDIFDVPLPRNPNFTGRDEMLRELHKKLQSNGAAPLSGLGGVGKTQLALEYAYRYASEYERVFWLRAEEPATLASDYAGIAARLKLPEKDLADQSAIVAAVRAWLAHNPGWLLVLDKATTPESCIACIPRPNAGHILITSRQTAWRSVADPIDVLQLSRQESVALLKKRTGRDEPQAADKLSDAVGDLPLALDQAAAYVESNGISIEEYVGLLGPYSKELLQPVAATWRISFEKLRTEETGALDLLNLIAWMAPDNIPRDLLKRTAENALAFNRRVEALRRYSLITTGDGVIGVHRLVQEVTQNGLEEALQKRWAEAAAKLVDDAFPFDSDDYRNWPACARLLAHALRVAENGERLAVGLVAVSRLLNQAGLYVQERAQLPTAERLLRKALEIGEKIYGPEQPEVAVSVNNVAQILQQQGDLAGALQYARRALQIDEKAYGPDHTKVAIRANNIGQILEEQGDLAGALESTRRALVIDEKFYGPDHPNVAIFANNIGQILQEQGDLAGALENARRALAIDERVYGADHPNVARDTSNIGQILRAQGDLTGALESTRRALAIDEKVYGPEHPNVARDANNLGQILRAQGDLAGAPDYTRRSLAIDEKIYGPDHPEVAIQANNIGMILKDQGDLNGALEYTRRALRIKQATYGPDNPSTKLTATNLQRIEAKLAATQM
jgi:tetratricopeptide (TPR) repeat protein